MTELARPIDGRDATTRVVPVSLGQRRLWFVDGLAGGGRDYVVVWPLRLVGVLDVERLVAAVGGVVARHEVLRSRFVGVDGEPVMVIDPPGPVVVQVLEGGDVARLVAEEGGRGFDLALGPVVRFRLVRVSAGEHVLVVAAHHIVFDGWSGSVFLRDLGALYAKNDLPDLAVSFSDFAVWERENGTPAESLEFWRECLAGAPSVMALPLDRARPVRRSGAGGRMPFEIAPEVLADLSDVCRRQGATLFMGLLGALNVVVSRYCGVSDVVIGTFAANRGVPELEELVGFFVNTLVLRTDVSGDPGFGAVVGRSRVAAVGAFAHQEVPFDRVVEAVAPVRVAGVTPFVQVALVVQNTPDLAGELAPGVSVESVPVEVVTSAFDLSVQVWETPGGGLDGFVEYSTELFDRVSVERFVTAFGLVLAAGTADPDRPMSELPLLPPGEPYTLLGPAVTGDERLADLLAARAARTPSAVAFTTGAAELTYADLDRRARALAARLHELGVGPESVVGVCLPPGLDLPVALLATLYAGGAYLPLDPLHPAERLTYLVEDSAAAVIVTDDDHAPLLPAHPRLVRLDDRPAPERSELRAADPDTVAAVIYTSGSTGRPKGVAITGRSLLNRLAWMGRELPFEPGEVCCQKTAISFVDSLWELLGPLLAGVPTVVPQPGAARDPLKLLDELAAHRVTRLLLVPSLLRVLLTTAPGLAERLPYLKLLISSGEPLSHELSRLCAESLPGRALINLYGASEAWDALCQRTADAEVPGPTGGVPVGRPLAGVRACVLDGRLRPLPVGVPGELYIGGRCLARGYLARPALTAERFLPDPAGSGERLYRTGDLARIRTDGQVELLGRADHQIKIRGVRVEPGEVEAVLEELPEVRQAAVVPVRTGEEAHLVAHVVPTGEGDAAELRGELARRLPAHLVPAWIVLREELPRTATGKIDRRVLADAGLPTPEPAGPAPLSGLERRIAALWAEVLGREVGGHDDFFDVGGHSLLAPVLAGRLSAELAVDLPMSWVFDHPTVHAMSRSPQIASCGGKSCGYKSCGGESCGDKSCGEKRSGHE